MPVSMISCVSVDDVHDLFNCRCGGRIRRIDALLLFAQRSNWAKNVSACAKIRLIKMRIDCSPKRTDTLINRIMMYCINTSLLCCTVYFLILITVRNPTSHMPSIIVLTPMDVVCDYALKLYLRGHLHRGTKMYALFHRSERLWSLIVPLGYCNALLAMLNSREYLRESSRNTRSDDISLALQNMSGDSNWSQSAGACDGEKRARLSITPFVSSSVHICPVDNRTDSIWLHFLQCGQQSTKINELEIRVSKTAHSFTVNGDSTDALDAMRTKNDGLMNEV